MKKKRLILLVTIIFMISTFGVLRYTYKVDVITFGDSNTENSNWSSQKYDKNKKWVTLLKNQTHQNILNLGVAGSTSSSGLKRSIVDIILREPSTLYIMFGTNDATLGFNGISGVSKDKFQRNLQCMITVAKLSGSEPILMTSIPIIEGNGKDGYYATRQPSDLYRKFGGIKTWHNSYNDIVRELAIKNHITLIDNWNDFIAKAGSDSDQKLIQSGLIDSSGIHLTPKGSVLIVQNILSAIK